jgi:hypothetical protein
MISHLAPPQTWDHPPGISVLCPTYGRAARLPGLVQSFLQQDYAGPLELIILNDRHDQTFAVDPTNSFVRNGYRKVYVINMGHQFPTLSDKRNRLLDMAAFPYVAWWDDDDRFLPSRLTTGMQMMRVGFQASHEPQIWLNDGKSVTLSGAWSPFATAIIEKQAIVDAGGFTTQQLVDEDIALMQVLVHRLRAFPVEATGACPTTIYRKPGTSNHAHVGEAGVPSSSHDARVYMQGSVETRINNGQEPIGIITIVPKWGVDYAALVRAAWTALHPLPL